MKYIFLILFGLSIFLQAAPNLLPNGKFEQLKGKKVAHWEEPDGLTAQWDKEPGRGRILKLDSRMEMCQVKEFREKRKENPALPAPAPILATGEKYSALGGDEGALFDSDTIRVKPGQDYRLTVTAKGIGTPWVFIKGFLMHPHQKRLVDAYQTRMHCGPLSPNEWRTFTIGFNPTKRTPRVTDIKVRFMVYWPPAVCFFDDIKIEAITPDEMSEEIKKRENTTAIP